MADSQTATDSNGQYAFTGLRSGTYSVEISGFDGDEVGFGSVSSSATVGVGESKIISFDGTYLRTAGIEGRVSIEGEGLSGVTVSLGGSESGTTTTDAGGRYAFAKLKAGVYTVAISGYDADDYEFESTSESVTLATGETANIPFEGTLLRTAGISGRVSVGGMGLAGVTVSLSGMDDPREATTNAQGQYGFAGLAEGTYVLSMTNPDAAEYSFETERSVTLAQSESKIENFEGTSLRTAGVAGMVTVEGSGVSDVTVTLIRVTGATSGDVMGIQQTGDDGGYAFGDLLAGAYRVDISGFNAEYAFEHTTQQGQVAMATVAKWDFAGTIIRTASIAGMVTVEGSGKEGVTVSLAGGTDGVATSKTTGADGGYMFDGLRRGDYTVTITNPDAARYSFTATERKVSVGVGQTQDDVSFAGTMLRQGTISGRVHAEGTGIPGATVTLAGAMDDTAETDDQGNYAFTDLGPGTYVVSLTNPDEAAYEFASMTENVTLDNADDKKTVNFGGTHTRTASISGVLFIDEVMQDKMHTAGEPTIVEALAPWLAIQDDATKAMVAGLLTQAKVIIRGPSLNDPPTEVQINADGTFTTGEALMAGSYQVELPANNEMVAAALAAAGVAFVGESDVVAVAAGGSETVNFPFRITMQTIGVGAVMGSAEMVSDPPLPVGGVELALFPTAEDADDGTNMLGMAMKTGETGMAGFTFARADDTSPGSDDTDNIVFVRVVDAGHEDLMVSDRDIIEVQYPGIARVHGAPTTVRFQNVAVNFQFWIKNDENARGGDMLVDGWHTQVFMGEVTDESMPLMMEDEDGEMVNLTMPSESEEDEDGMQGRVMVSYRVTPDQLPATFSAALRPDTDDWQQPMAMGETWNEVGDGLTYTHTGFELPALNTHEVNDLNLNPKFGQAPARVTFTTQKLTVGVYREADDVAGFSDFQSRVSHGDHRPAADVAAELSVSVMVTASGRRGLEVYDEWDHDGDPMTDPVDATKTGLTGGMATFGNLPADMDFTVQFNEGSDRVAVGGPDSRSDRVQAYGDDLDLGMSTGAFGDESGAGPEVELCPLTTDTRPSSLGDDDSDCATFAYQWNTGSITGDVGRAVKDLDVSIEADTDLHSDAPRDTETDTKGEFSWSGVQDGVYSIAVASSDDYNVTPTKGVRVDVYHDEFEDDKNEDTDYIGTADTDHADFSATKLRLSIKGYAANISHETNDVVRGDETYEGAELELYAYNSRSRAKIKSTGSVVATATVGSDGLYEFNDLDEGRYVIVAKNTDDYEMYADGPDVHYINNVAADTYKDDGVLEQALTLPYWDYEASDVKNTRSPHTVGTGAAAESFTYYNFALLHGDGEFSGRVFEARGEPGGIAVELRRCETYTPDDATTTDDDEERCREDTDFGALTEDAGSKGRWDFPSLREGYYVANIAATTYNQAKWDDDGIDDDAANCEGSDPATVDADCDDDRTVDMFGMLEGKSAFNRGGATFRVYNRTLGYDAELSGLVIEGTKDAEDGDEELEDFTVTAHDDGVANDIGTVGDPITYASESITLTPSLEDDNASVEVIVGDDLDDPDDTGSGDDGDEIEVDLEMGVNTVTVIVTAENAYDDRMYSFEVERMAPVANTLADLGLRSTRDVATGSAIPISPTFGAMTEYTATVPTGTGTGDDMSVYVLATVRLLQQAITVTYSDGGTMTELDAENPRNNDGAREKVYKVTIPRTGALNDKSVLVKVTSEDGKALPYEIELRRGEGDPTNAAPVFTSDDEFDVAENETAVGTVTATDPDDDVTGYEITGGDDMDQFAIDDDGELTFEDAPDFESPDDDNDDNIYEVTVTATSGTGDRALTADQEITVTVTDVDVETPTTPTVTLMLDPTSIDEDGGVSTVTATVSPASETAFVVTVSLDAGAAGKANLSTTELTFAATETASTDAMTITAVADDDTDNETITVSGSVPEDSGVTDPADVELTISEGTVPSEPRNLEAASSDQGLILTWIGPSEVGRSAVTDYEWSVMATGQLPKSGMTNATTLTASPAGLTNGATYTVEVRAINPAGKSEPATVTETPWPIVTFTLVPSTVSEGADPAESSTVTAELSNPSLNALMMTVSVDDAQKAYASMSGNILRFAAFATVSTGEVKITPVDDKVASGTEDNTRTVPVSGKMSEEGIDDISADLTINDDDRVPSAPGSFEAVPEDAKVILTWAFPSVQGSLDVTGFELRYKEGTTGDLTDKDAWKPLGGGANMLRYVVTELTNDTEHVFEVRAVSGAGASPAVSVTATPKSS